MTDELKLRRDAERAAQAEALLRNELVKQAFVELKATYLNAWEGSHARDTEARERLWQAVQIVGKVESHLQNIVANGELAKHELQAIAGKPKRFGIV